MFDTLARIQEGRAGQAFARGGEPFGRRGAPPTDGRRGPVPQVPLGPELDSILRSAANLREESARRTNSLDATAFDKRAATLGAPRRIFVTQPRLSTSLQASATTAAALVDSARNAFGATKRFIPVAADTVEFALAKTRTIDDLAKILNADVFASFTAFRVGRDSVQWQLTLRDLSAHTAYRSRLVNFYAAPISEPTPRLGEALGVAARLLNEMDRAPRSPGAPPTPGRP
ncbi:MAG: hypothetical protein FJ202_00230 [Gemmatimonadetes bacterium]|nr:hypothetical protein [Gemmatimonadota bacterium]